MSKKENIITLEDEQGNGTDFELLFSIVYKKTNVRYLYVLDPNDKTNETVIVFSCDEEGNVETVDESEDDELREFIQDTFAAYENGDLVPVNEDGELEEIEEEHECCCNKHHHEDEHHCCKHHEKDNDDSNHHCCCHND